MGACAVCRKLVNVASRMLPRAPYILSLLPLNLQRCASCAPSSLPSPPQGVRGMRVGGLRRVLVPPELVGGEHFTACGRKWDKTAAN